MRAKHWLIGCALCIVGIGNAAATSVDTRDQDGSLHAATDSTISHDGGNNSNGDVLGLNRDGSSRSTSSDSASGSSSNGNDHTGGAASAPAPIRQPRLGWQSLLPGSIQ